MSPHTCVPCVRSIHFTKEKYPKERRPPVCDPFAVRRGKPAAGRLWGAPWNSLCAARAAQTATASQSTKHARSDARATPQPPRRRRSQQGVDSRTSKQSNSRTSIRAIAALGPVCAARGACAREVGPSEAKARVDVLLPVPLWMRRGAQGLADQGSRVFERRAAARVERDPAKPEHRRLPRSVSAGDADSGVALSLVPFFRRRCMDRTHGTQVCGDIGNTSPWQTLPRRNLCPGNREIS